MTNLPSTWIEVPITEVLDPNHNGKPFQQGWSPRCENVPAPEGDWGVLKTTAIQEGEFWSHANKRLPDHLEPKPNIEVLKGDVLMTCAGPRSRCGVVCTVEQTRPKLMMSGKMYRFRPNPSVMNAKFLSYFIRTRDAQVAIDRMKTGISDSGLNLTHDRFAQLMTPVAPRLEQDRIVGKIDELFSEIDRGVESLRTARAQLHLYRQSLLKNAFEGKLTASWRAEQVNYSTPLNDSIDRKSQEEESLADLPHEWRYVRLSSVTDADRPITYGVIKLGKDVVGGIPTLRSSDVRKLKIDIENVKQISPGIADNYRRTFLRGGEVLITVRGTLGGVAVVPESLSGWNISREVAMIAPDSDIDATYLQYMLGSPQLEAWFKTRLRGVAYTGINLETLRDAPVILCSLAEQEKIVQELEENFSSIDAVEQYLESQLVMAEALRKSILKRAFLGKLVAQHPDDEPASVMLEKIKAERETASTRCRRKAKEASNA